MSVLLGTSLMFFSHFLAPVFEENKTENESKSSVSASASASMSRVAHWLKFTICQQEELSACCSRRRFERKCCHWQFRAPFRLLAERRVTFMANGSPRVIYGPVCVCSILLLQGGTGGVLNYVREGRRTLSRLERLFNSLLGRKHKQRPMWKSN